MSVRRIALVLGVNRKTVTRKFVFLGEQAKRKRLEALEDLKKLPDKLDLFHFDEMESFIHSKCLPVSIPLVVLPQSRKILSFRVGEMPAKGPLASISRQKYGPRPDRRPQMALEVFSEIQGVFTPDVQVVSDSNPKYERWIRGVFPKARRKVHLGRRGCIVGQGELKKIGFDPLFSLNHTAAMLRANLNRLARRTWCHDQETRPFGTSHGALYPIP